jgi:small subunit ribosomal protein S8
MDQIADMIVRIKNGGDSKKESVVFHYSKMKSAILDVLLKEGFVKSFGKKGKKVVKYIEVVLSYDENGNSMVHGVKRVSKLGKRVYIKSQDIRKVRNGLGILVVSTPKGIMSDKEAKSSNVGGEALFEIW